MIRIILSVVCVLAAAWPAGAELTAADVAGRWQGESYGLAHSSGLCADDGCKLTFDIIHCGAGWCGVLVGSDNACGATALKLDAGEAQPDTLLFQGNLELAHGTEPYVVRAYLVAAAGDTPMTLQITGDTGGEFRAFRRSFPFEATLARLSDPICHPPQTVSSAD